MANHGWLTTKKPMTHEGLTADLRELNRTLFKDRFVLEPYIAGTEKGFSLYFQDTQICVFWMKSSRKLEFRHQHPNWVMWVELQIQDYLGRKYNGMITDEGVEGRWRPDGHKYPTIVSWMMGSLGWEKRGIVHDRFFAALARQSIPKELRAMRRVENVTQNKKPSRA